MINTKHLCITCGGNRKKMNKYLAVKQFRAIYLVINECKKQILQRNNTSIFFSFFMYSVEL